MRGRAKALPRSFAILLCIVTALVFMPTLPGGQASAAGVVINSTNFPDANFRAILKEKFDSNGDNYLSDAEIQNATELDLGGHHNYSGGESTYHPVGTLSGIGNLKYLKKLNCDSGHLKTLT